MIGGIVGGSLEKVKSANGRGSDVYGSDAWRYRHHLRRVARKSRDVLPLVSPQEAEVGSGVAVRRSGHEAMDAHLHADPGSMLLPGRAMARMDCHDQNIDAML